MMYDPDVICYLFAAEGPGYQRALDTIYMEENKLLFVPAAPREVQSLDIFADRSVRAATVPLDDEAEEKKRKERQTRNIHEDGPCLKITFSQRSRTKKGRVAGRGRGCDINLPNLKWISWEHFSFTYDHDNELIVRDLFSTIGTRLLYHNETDSERGRGVDFSAKGPKILGGKPAVIKLATELQFKLVVPDHDTSSPEYLEKVKNFHEDIPLVEDLLPGLGLVGRTQTELPTPSSEGLVLASDVPGAILWTRKIGQGGFAVVDYAWDVKTRKDFARKTPLPGYYEKDMWTQEASVMKGLRHDNIVQLKFAILDNGRPELFFEFVHMGALTQYQASSTPFQRKQTMLQVFQGLEYLHERDIPIIHRDIKHENILVEKWSECEVHIKLGDFGLSKAGKLLKTFCGSLWYLAPEGYTVQTGATYSPKVDVWSAGVLAVWLEVGKRPKWETRFETDGKAWAELMVGYTEKKMRLCGGHNELLSFAIDYMLIIHPADRATARHCRIRAAEIAVAEKADVFRETDSATLQSDDSNSDSQPHDESQPTTPKALPMDEPNFTQDLSLGERVSVSIETDTDTGSGAATIRQGLSLARRDYAVDSLLGMARTSKATTPVTAVRNTSTVNGNLWTGSSGDWDLMNSVEDENEDGDDVEDLAPAVQIKRKLEEKAEDTDDTVAVIDGAQPVDGVTSLRNGKKKVKTVSSEEVEK